MSENQSLINISTGSEDDEYNKIFVQIAFCLKQGKSEIRIYDTNGIISYIDADGENLRKLQFDRANISLTYSSFNKALKKILSLDRQYVNKIRGVNAFYRIEDASILCKDPVDSSLDEIRKILPEAN